ncbi:MAG: hypothetical protein IH851_02780 [Armatimonadetes bacterium]|nr:hypothetical protein [Armatimonadota bacterium]
MPKWKSGDRVRIKEREVKPDDRESNTYFAHFADLDGTVQAVYGKDEVAVRIDPECFRPLLAGVHKEAVRRMRAKFLDGLSEEQKRKLTREEKRFAANYVVLVKSEDLVKGREPPKSVPVPERDDEDDAETYDGTSVVEEAVYDDPSIRDEAPRKSLSDLDAAEEEELRRRN